MKVGCGHSFVAGTICQIPSLKDLREVFWTIASSGAAPSEYTAHHRHTFIGCNSRTGTFVKGLVYGAFPVFVLVSQHITSVS